MQPPHLMHGLGAAAIPADWPPIQPAEAEALLARLGRPDSLRALRWHSPRPYSAATVADTRLGPLVIKRHHHRLRTCADLEEEHRFITHLQTRGLPVPSLLRDAEGRSAFAAGPWTYEVQRLADGEDLYRQAPSWTPFLAVDHAHAAGAMLARLHAAAADFQAPPRATHLLVGRLRLFGQAQPLPALERELTARPALARWLAGRGDWRGELQRHLLRPWHAQARAALARPGIATPLWTHGDWHGSNLLWQRIASGRTRVVSVLDFGLADRSFALYDLAIAIERSLVPWLALDTGRPAEPALDQLDALLAGYGAIRSLDASRLRALAALLPIVHADYALGEVEYYAGLTGSDTHAGIAWQRYLLGHADWFASAEGRRLLARLQRAARRAP